MTAPGMNRIEVWCRAIQNFVTIQGDDCSYRSGAGDGSPTAPCLFKGTQKCPLKQKKEESL